MKTKFIIAGLLLAFLSACTSTSTKPSQESLTNLCKNNNLKDTDYRDLLAGGYFALEKNDLVCAERLTTEAHQKDAKDPYATLNLGAIYQRTNRSALAREMYAKTIELDGGQKQTEKSGEVEVATIATRDDSRGQRPNQIARYNLSLMPK